MKRLNVELLGRHRLPKGFELTTVGLRMPEDLALEDWELFGAAFARSESSLNWALGDWLVYAETRYGEKYKLAAELTGRTARYVANIASVARNVQMSCRNDKLTFTHHTAVASLLPDTQTAWLKQAEQELWSVAKLQKAISRAQEPEFAQAPVIVSPSNWGDSTQAVTLRPEGRDVGTYGGDVTTEDNGVAVSVPRSVHIQVLALARRAGQSIEEYLAVVIGGLHAALAGGDAEEGAPKSNEEVGVPQASENASASDDLGHDLMASLLTTMGESEHTEAL